MITRCFRRYRGVTIRGSIPELGRRRRTLAEALLWKMGKWKVYEKFVKHHHRPSGPGKTDVMFYAFARHLDKPFDEPIYDQHALRALWAIVPDDKRREFDAECAPLLVNSKGRAKDGWKVNGSGSSSTAAYVLYVKTVKGVANKECHLGTLDQLLMPLGQALKKRTKTLADFRELCEMD